MTTIGFVNLTNLNLTIFDSREDTIGKTYPATGLRAVDTLYGKGERVNVGSPISCAPQDIGADRVQVQTMATDGRTILDTNPMPAPRRGVLYIVPIPVQQALWSAGRRDVVGMGNTRQQDGKPIGAEGFVYQGTADDLRAVLSGAAE
jgi:hypothetical protein